LYQAQLHHLQPELMSQFDIFEKQLRALLRNIAEMKHNIAVRDKVVENMTEETMGGDDKISTPEDIIQREMNELVEEIANTRFFINLFLSRL
jgi:FKBP-type peptidyl-prolyl cis-trans isomerase (trigger factor)